MTATLALAGDTMLGRGVAEVLLRDPAAPLFAPNVAAHMLRADAVVLNLECCVSSPSPITLRRTPPGRPSPAWRGRISRRGRRIGRWRPHSPDQAPMPCS